MAPATEELMKLREQIDDHCIVGIIGDVGIVAIAIESRALGCVCQKISRCAEVMFRFELGLRSLLYLKAVVELGNVCSVAIHLGSDVWV